MLLLICCWFSLILRLLSLLVLILMLLMHSLLVLPVGVLFCVDDLCVAFAVRANVGFVVDIVADIR